MARAAQTFAKPGSFPPVCEAIYRHVWLTRTNPVHVAHWGTFVRSQVGPAGATILITTEIDNDTATARPRQVVSTVVDGNGKALATARSLAAAVPASRRRAVEQQVVVAKPALWSPVEPNLYLLV